MSIYFGGFFMNSDKREDYYVGLDMGTGSLGGAVTDTQYHLLKVKPNPFPSLPEMTFLHLTHQI